MLPLQWSYLSPNIRVGFWVGTSFLRFPKFDFNVIFGKFGTEQIPKFDFNVIFSSFLESSEQNKFRIFHKFGMLGHPCFWASFFLTLTPKTLKTGFLTQKEVFFKLKNVWCVVLTQKQEIVSKLFSQNFQKTGYFWKISELQKPNYSETREKFF